MKKVILLFSLQLLFVQCTLRLMAPPLFVHDLNGTERIDMRVLSRYSNEDSLMTGRKIVYQKDKQTVTVNSTYGAKGASFDLIIKGAGVENMLMVSRNTYHIVSIYRESRNLKDRDIVDKYGYYKDGSLRFKFSERDIPDVSPPAIKVGTVTTYSEKGDIQTFINCDKEFTFDIYDVIRLYKRKIKEQGLSVRQIFSSASSNPNYLYSYPLIGPYASLKPEYPYWKVETKDQVSGIITIRILDGRNGEIVSSFKYSLTVIE